MTHHHHHTGLSETFYHEHPRHLRDPEHPDVKWSVPHYGHDHRHGELLASMGITEPTPSSLHLTGTTHIADGVHQTWPT